MINVKATKKSVCGIFANSWIAVGVLLLGGCAGTGSFTTYDKESDSITLQTSADGRTAMPQLNQNAAVQSAMNDLKATIKAEPKNVKALLNLAGLQLASFDFDGSMASVRKALRYDLKSRDAKKLLAQIYLRTQNYDMATIILNGLGGVDSKDSDVYNMLATIALAEGRNTEALNLYRQGLDLDPDNVSLRMNLGVLYIRYRQLSKASIQFERVLQIIPDHNDAKLHIATIKSVQGNSEEAMESYKTILSRKAKNPLALYNLAVLQTKKKNYDAAASLLNEYLNAAYAKNSSNDDVYSLLEEIDTRKRGDAGLSDDEAMSIAEKMNNQDKGNPKQPVAKSPASPLDTPSETGVIEDDIKALEQQLQ